MHNTGGCFTGHPVGFQGPANCLSLSQSQPKLPLCQGHVQPAEGSQYLPGGDGGAGQVCGSATMPGVNPQPGSCILRFLLGHLGRGVGAEHVPRWSLTLGGPW